MRASERVFGLDVLRAIAIALVLISHAIQLLVELDPQLRRPRIIGFLGVETFFVLSGFLIGRILFGYGDRLGTLSGLTHFWGRRWLRTLPNYYLYLGIAWWFAPTFGYVLPDHTTRYLYFAQNWWAHGSYGFFGHGWSLSVEEWFYILVPATLALLTVARWPIQRALAVVGTLGLLLPIGLRYVASVHASTVWWTTRSTVPLRLDAPMVGVLAAWVALRYVPAWERWRWPAFVVGLLGVVTGLGTFDIASAETSLYMRVLHPTVVQVSVALLLPLLSQWHLATETPLSRSVTTVALWSYSLYLVNSLVVHFMATQAPTGAFGPTALVWVTVFLMASVGLAGVTYRYWELPWMALRDRLPRRHAVPATERE